MKYFDYRERRQQGTFDFPIAFYHMDPSHPRYQMPYHWHPEYEIIRILEGHFHLTLGSQTFIVSKGDILFLQDGVLHGGIPEHCIYECLVFDMKLLLKENNSCARQTQKIMRHEIIIPQQLPKDIPSLQATVKGLFHSMAEKEDGYEFLTQGYLYQLLGILFREHLYEENTSAPHISHQHVLQFKKVLSYIEDNYTERIALEDMARVAGMNSKYFCRFFREMSYRTPIDYLNYYRIERACEQLITTKATIIEVAFNCGFNDISYFIKTFHKYKGITPKQYLIKEFTEVKADLASIES
jgi:AraC-like DNA-binding protein